MKVVMLYEKKVNHSGLIIVITAIKTKGKKVYSFLNTSKSQIMNIWILTSELPPNYGGGIGTYVDCASKMFAQKGHKVSIITFDDTEDSIEYQSDNIRIVRFRHFEGEQYAYLGYWPALSLQFANEVEKLLENSNEIPDIIEVQEYNAIGYYLQQRKLLYDSVLKNIPIVVHLHTPTFELNKINQFPRYKFPNYWISQMEKNSIIAADAVMSPSFFLKNEIENELGENSVPIDVIRLPYMNSKFEEQPVKEFKSKTIIYFGRFEHRKGVCALLAAVDRLWNQGLEFKLKMIGGDTYFQPRKVMLREWLAMKYKKWLDEGRLIFKDNMHPQKLADEIWDADIACIPSLYENHPYACVESMWSKTPMLVSKRGGQAEMVGNDGTCGYVFDWEVEGDFEFKIRNILQLSSDELKEMGNNAYKKIHNMCNLDTIYCQRIAYFEKVIFEYRAKEYYPSLNNNTNYEKEEEKDKLSIIIPYYNLGKYLKETLESALNVDYSDVEIVIVNDGTTDKFSKGVLEDIRDLKYENVKIVDIPNSGLANARNIGASNSSGRFITFLDADDLVYSDFYSKAIRVLKKYKNVSFVYSWLSYFDGAEGVWPTFNAEFPYLLVGNMLSAFAVVEKKHYEKYGQNRSVMEYGMEDYDGWIQMLENGCLGVSLPEVLVKYRVRMDSMSKSFNRDKVLYLFDVMSNGHKSVYEKYAAEIFNLMVANGPGYLWNNPTFEHNSVDYVDRSEWVSEKNINNEQYLKYELKRIMNSKWGQRLIRILFRYRINKIFK